MKIQVIGSTPPCARCRATENVVKSVVEELGYADIEVEKLDVFSQEAEALGILMTPTNAKALHKALGDNLEKYEKRFGEIKIAPEELEARERPLGFVHRE